MLMKINPIAIKLGSVEIRWYAICILTGAFLAYLFSKIIFKKSGYGGEIADDIVLVALPAGILGARIWWCISDSGSPWHNGDFWGFLTKFTDGGLAIQGGVILGAAAGIAVVLIKYKNVPIRAAMDAVIPNILIGQALGRWGNFCNQEVYGAPVTADKLWFLPKFILNQMEGDLVNGVNVGEYKDLGASILYEKGLYAQPLFLYESLLNLLGLVLITVVLRKFWKKRIDGDLSALYLIWYGAVRFFLEPLRSQEFIMSGFGKMPVSQFTSLLFIIGGILFMVALRVMPKLFKKEAK